MVQITETRDPNQIVLAGFVWFCGLNLHTYLCLLACRINLKEEVVEISILEDSIPKHLKLETSRTLELGYYPTIAEMDIPLVSR